MSGKDLEVMKVPSEFKHKVEKLKGKYDDIRYNYEVIEKYMDDLEDKIRVKHREDLEGRLDTLEDDYKNLLNMIKSLSSRVDDVEKDIEKGNNPLVHEDDEDIPGWKKNML